MLLSNAENPGEMVWSAAVTLTVGKPALEGESLVAVTCEAIVTVVISVVIGKTSMGVTLLDELVGCDAVLDATTEDRATGVEVEADTEGEDAPSAAATAGTPVLSGINPGSVIEAAPGTLFASDGTWMKIFFPLRILGRYEAMPAFIAPEPDIVTDLFLAELPLGLWEMSTSIQDV